MNGVGAPFAKGGSRGCRGTVSHAHQVINICIVFLRGLRGLAPFLEYGTPVPFCYALEKCRTQTY